MFSQDLTGVKPVLVFFQAGDCGACNNFKPQWPLIKDKIKQNCNIDFEEVILETKSSPVKDPRLPEDLNRYRPPWLPSFALITGKSWSEAKHNKKAPLQGVVYNAVRNGNSWNMVSPTAPYNDPALIAWIKGLVGTGAMSNVEPVNQNYGGYCAVSKNFKPYKF